MPASSFKMFQLWLVGTWLLGADSTMWHLGVSNRATMCMVLLTIHSKAALGFAMVGSGVACAGPKWTSLTSRLVCRGMGYSRSQDVSAWFNITLSIVVVFTNIVGNLCRCLRCLYWMRLSFHYSTITWTVPIMQPQFLRVCLWKYLSQIFAVTLRSPLTLLVFPKQSSSQGSMECQWIILVLLCQRMLFPTGRLTSSPVLGFQVLRYNFCPLKLTWTIKMFKLSKYPCLCDQTILKAFCSQIPLQLVLSCPTTCGQQTYSKRSNLVHLHHLRQVLDLLLVVLVAVLLPF
jgi:hypothetical protein